MREPSEVAVPPAFVADESRFLCVVERPDPDARRRQRRTKGVVMAYPTRPEGAPFAGWLFYFANESNLETISFCVQPEFRGMGCTTEMVKALRRAYLGRRLASSPARPTQLGRDTLISLHRRGLIDELRIDLTGEVCEPEIGRCDER